jgi:hypothetical protein
MEPQAQMEVLQHQLEGPLSSKVSMCTSWNFSFMEAVWNFDLERSGHVNLVIEHSDVTDCWNKNEKTIYLLACFVQNFQTLGRLYREFKVGWMAIQTPSVQHPWPHTVEMLKCSRGFLNLSFCQWRTCCIFVEDMALYTCTLDMSNHLSLMGFDLPPWSPFKFFWTLSPDHNRRWYRSDVLCV